VFMRPRLGSRGGTFTDVACRGKTSCPAPGPCDPVTGLASAGRARRHQPFCGSGRDPGQDDRGDLAAAIDGMCRSRVLAGQWRRVIMAVCRGGRPAGGRGATRCSSACRAAAGGVPGERSARRAGQPVG
jgi:hypothetical protein